MLASIAACGGSTQSQQAAAVANAAMKAGDLPAGMVRCDLTGDMGSFLDKEKSADPATYATVKADWSAAQKDGATAAYAAFFTDTGSHCTGFNPAVATYPAAVNFVLQFKDEATAADGYANGSFFHYSVADLKSGGLPVIEGPATGLTANSIVRVAYLTTQTWYIAIWQSKSFLVILAILNVDSTAAQKAAASENSRIK